MIDDHSRLFLASRAFPTAKAADVVEVFRSAIDLHGAPASLLCDNGAVFTATPRGGKVLLQLEMERLGDRRQELAALPPPDLRQGRAPAPDAEALPGKAGSREDARRAAGPARCLRALLQRDQAPPGPGRAHAPSGLQRPREGPAGDCDRARHPFPHPPRQGRRTGKVSLRHDSKLHHIGLGRAHKGKPIKLLVADRDIRVLDARTGELIRRLTLDPSRDYQPIGGG